MALTIYDSAEIVAEVRTGRRFFPFLLDIAFALQKIVNTEYLAFEKKAYLRNIMPLTDYKTPATVTDTIGYSTEVFKPAYFKSLDSVEFDELNTKDFGAPFYQTPTYADALIRLAGEHYDKWNRTKEYIGSQILRTGKVNITGQDYVTYTLDFKRNANLTKVLTGADRWGEVGAENKPLADIESFLERLNKPAKKIVFGHNAWKNFKADANFEKLVDTRYRNLTQVQAERAPVQMPENRSDIEVGSIPSMGVTLHTYKEHIVDTEGTSIDLIGTDEVLFIPDSALGVVGYARIKDVAAMATLVVTIGAMIVGILVFGHA